MSALEEPATAITDWVMAGFAAWWAASLLSAGTSGGDAGIATTLWGAAFAATALSAGAGGVVHGFGQRLGPARATPLWRATLHSITLASAAVLFAALLVFEPSPARAAGLALTGTKLIGATFLLLRRPDFGVALLDHAIALAAVLALQLVAWRAHDAASAPWIAAGVGLAAVAAAVQAARVSPHPRFNHNDLYHVVQIGALWLLYRGGLLLGGG